MNLLLITADQWRGDCLGAAGHPLLRTPHLDALAAAGVRFANHYAGAAPCSPARACLYTGLYQMNHRVCRNGTPLARRHDNVALALRRGGYLPTLFGYTDQSADPEQTAEGDPDLTTYEGLLPGFFPRVQLPEHDGPWLSWLASKGYAEEQLVWPGIHRPLSGVSDPPVRTPPVYSAEHTQTAFLVDEFLDWRAEQQRQRTRPGWFAHISFLRPHPPFVVPQPYNTMYSEDLVPAFAGAIARERIASQHPYLEYAFGQMSKSSFIPGTTGRVRDWDNAALRVIAALYYGMISEVDHQIGRLIEALRDSGEWDNTLIVFTSDHGEMMGDHGMLGKHGFYDASYHIPLIIRHPALPHTHGRIVNEFSEAVDVLPTTLDSLALPVPHQLDGRSLLPALNGQPLSDWRASAHWEFDFRSIVDRSAESHFGVSSALCNLSVIRDHRYKYVHFAAMPPVLFDLREDPDETHNVAEQESYQPVRLYLAEKLLRWRAEHLDQTLAMAQLTENGIGRGR